MFRPYAVFLLLLGAAWQAQAGWYLDNESSRISFISSKQGTLSEVHRFLTLHGTIDDAGQALLRIELDSVSTGVPLRDQRLRQWLFEVAHFPEARVAARLDLGPITNLAPGAQLELRLPLSLTLHGKTRHYQADLLATRLDDHRFQVVTLAPLVLQAPDFGLAAGLERLRAGAGLDLLSPSVPVGAVLIFGER
ncbi:YceI family protein [Pseudomonas sp. RIT-PI-AD]|uniref:YceI family protein n=1 Tax=Pseudomonas sp. RIT-PI-AD TaxID=3035294 RepID=UPI0021D9C721|nr:YceI family protein [Pseudomonas sp. RIT-PI-AD]